MAGRDPLAPLSTLVDVVFALIVTFALFSAVVTGLHLFGKADGAQLFSFSDHVCVEAESFMASVGEDDAPAEPLAKPGSSLQTSGTMFCTQNPSWAMQWAASVGSILSMMLLIGACLLARRVIRAARRDGIFTAVPAKLTRTLGWFLIAMAFIAPVGTDIGNGIFMASAAAPVLELAWTMEVTSIGGPDWTPLILGICALTFSRVMYRGAALQDDVALTI
ncbi:DUF2975 domain-containing protein [Nocardioides albus]|uniref:DUF2975 domain-containing protein n=1 Tax=Nocardioides albus TaxID=1841 RepID=A0A7W5A2I5_9ACTN|nr:DUF2975 domain-containing protein [Nocardioides albus]MBB3088294.1 hypothetical protein [Nocardioides albus]GGU42453.1 hypothetical protein GCM10007979_47130 [Nocardioides albus]